MIYYDLQFCIYLYFSESLLLVAYSAQFPVCFFLVLQQSGVLRTQPGNLLFLFFVFGFCLCFFFGSMGDQFRRRELFGGLFPDSLEKLAHHFRSLVTGLHALFYLFQFSDDLFQWGIIESVTLQVKPGTLEIFQRKGNKVFTEYSVCLAI